VPLATLTAAVTDFVGSHGVYAVFVLMLVDAVFPAASELVMVYGGALASGAFSGDGLVLFGHHIHSNLGGYLAIALAGTLGYLVGSWLGWAVGALAGRPFVERHGSLFHVDGRKLDRADAWFRRYGRRAVLIGRVTPVVRSFVSIPAGFERMPLAPYTALTLIGSAIWCFALAGVGWGLGAGYGHFHRAFDVASIAVVATLVLVGVGFALRRREARRASAERAEASRGLLPGERLPGAPDYRVGHLAERGHERGSETPSDRGDHRRRSKSYEDARRDV
jgi:membrane protein DedA with SNARE-associated domain